MNKRAFVFVLVFFAWFAGPNVAIAAAPWVINKNAWSAADEASFSKFVESIFDSGCTSVASCMKGKGNWYRDRDPRGIEWWADCGRFPYLLRAYFAFHNQLPFQAAIIAEIRDPNDPNPVLQYSAGGNVIVRRRAVTTGMDGYRFIRGVVASVYTALYRVDSRLDIETDQYGDFYHVLIGREFIRPGTVVYDPNGHVATVAKVSDDGKITLLDSHPDNTVSRVPYTAAFRATSPAQGGGFKNWRPVQVLDATVGPQGELLGGRTVAAVNAETPGFSLEQFFGDQPNPRGSFAAAKWSTIDGVMGAKRYTDVVRARLSRGAVTYDPIKETSEGVNTLCTMMQDRVGAVQLASDAHIDQKEMPNGRLPLNIYGTSGEWEQYSTPSRDARLKTAAAEFRELVARILKLRAARSKRVRYAGNDMGRDMLRAYDEAAARCMITYKKSDGLGQTLAFSEAIRRLYAMSFDPYHCIELRWGAVTADELASCQSAGDKIAWYRAETRLRNSLERKYDKRMGWSLAELEARADMHPTDPAESVGSDIQLPLDARGLLFSARSLR